MENKTVELFEEHILGPLKNLIRKHHEETKADQPAPLVLNAEKIAPEEKEAPAVAAVPTHGDPSTVAFHPTPKASNP